MQVDFSKIKFDEKGLIPAIVQDAATNAVLMLAYMNGESLAKTVETGYTWFWSRSRQELWNKGASSGHVQKVVSIDYDCDGDSLLVKVEQKGAACHTGEIIMQVDFSKIKFDEKGLIPAIVQDAATNAVLMLAYMNGESLAKTVETGYTWFWSRSRQELWNKGASSGHVQKVVSIDYDCDGDSLLVKVEQKGAACHTGNYSCFSYPLWNSGAGRNLPVPEPDGIHGILAELYRVIQDKRVHGGEKSYTRYLFMSGQDKILKKVGEEAAETIIASKNNNGKEVLYEMSDLWYHCLVLLAYHNINPAELLNELGGRRSKENNSKY